MSQSPVVVIGAGLSGLVTTAELVARGRRVILLDQEGPQSFGGQAHWSLGGLLIIDTPLQRERGISDSLDLARGDWRTIAKFDAEGDESGKEWAEEYLRFAAGEMYEWLRGKGVEFVPVVANPERAIQGYVDGNTVPRTHVPWGMGPGLLAPFIEYVNRAIDAGEVTPLFRHRVDRLLIDDGATVGVAGSVLADDPVDRGRASNREIVDTFELVSDAVVIAAGGIGGNLDLVRRYWPTAELGAAPVSILRGVPEHVDGRMVHIAEEAGAQLVHLDRTWTYSEGLANHSPIWKDHGIRILPGPSSLWLDATGHRMESLVPGSDASGALHAVRASGYDHSWFVLTRGIAEIELTLGGADQNPSLRDPESAANRQPGMNPAVAAFLERGEDVAVADTLDELASKMRAIAPDVELDVDAMRAVVEQHDSGVDDLGTADRQLRAVRESNIAGADTFIVAAPLHRLLDANYGPLIAMRLRTITRKSLGGLKTDLEGHVLTENGKSLPGLWAVGESSGFGGGGSHGRGSLEGTFLGQCLLTGLRAAQSISREDDSAAMSAR